MKEGQPSSPKKEYKSRIIVGNKPEIPNPQEQDLTETAHRMGFPITSIKIHKLFEVQHSASNVLVAHDDALQMTERLFANPVYEQMNHVSTRLIPPTETVIVSSEIV